MPMQNRRPPSKYLPPRPHPTCGQGGGCYHIVLLEDKDKNKNKYQEHSKEYSNDAKKENNFKIYRGNEKQTNTKDPFRFVVSIKKS